MQMYIMYVEADAHSLASTPHQPLPTSVLSGGGGKAEGPSRVAAHQGLAHAQDKLADLIKGQKRKIAGVSGVSARGG